MALIIHAPNVHQGGGATLLKALLRVAAAQQNGDVVAWLDVRLPLYTDGMEGIKMHKVPPSVLGRLKAEWNLRECTQKDDVILAFGNLPPLFPPTARCVLFMQNRYLVDSASTNMFPWRVRIRLGIERLWLKATTRHIDMVVVQSPTMSQLTQATLGLDPQILPFIDRTRLSRMNVDVKKDGSGKKYDFVYVSSAEPHKNHGRLIEAWELLAEESE